MSVCAHDRPSSVERNTPAGVTASTVDVAGGYTSTSPVREWVIPRERHSQLRPRFALR